MFEKQYTVHVISHTHWDREWYQTQQQFRMGLVRTVDTVLDYVRENPGFRCFLLDGQAILIDDYLAVRPEKREEIRNCVAERRLFIGPWYTQPDEFLVSAESLVRNLQLGIRTARSYGRTMRLGWIPDTFGHIAQLPQILNEFGIRAAALTRGIGDQLPEPRTEFLWRSPNGSEVLVLHQMQGYFSAGLLAFPFFWGDVSNIAPSAQRAAVRVSQLLDSLKQAAGSNNLVLWNGADHMPPEPGIAETIDELNDISRDYHFVHSDAETLAEAVRAEATDLPVVQGELRGSRYHPLLYSILSTRTYLKQRNSAIQRLLERYTEPISALASIVPREDLSPGAAARYRYPASELREAWKLLLQNHGHDSIGGCSIDQVHREMITRFDQSEQIAFRIAFESLKHLAGVLDTTWAPDDAPMCVCYNPSDRQRYRVVRHAFRSARRIGEAIAVRDRNGSHLAAQLLAHEEHSHGWLDRDTTVAGCLSNLAWWQEVLKRMDELDVAAFDIETRPNEGITLRLYLSDYGGIETGTLSRLEEQLHAFDHNAPVTLRATYVRHEIAFAALLDPVSYSAFAITSSDSGNNLRSESSEEKALVRYHDGRPSLVWSGGTIEVEDTGSLRLTTLDGSVYAGLAQLVDQGDGGDTYDFSPVGPERALVLEDEPVIEVLQHGPVIASLEVRFESRLPAWLESDRDRRSLATVNVAVRMCVTVEAMSDIVRVRTRIDNAVWDHRVRALFPYRPVVSAPNPSNDQSPCLWVDAPFAVERRQLRPSGGADWEQQPASIQPHLNWVGLGSDTSAVAVVSDGLHEHEIVDTPFGQAIALTLLRSVGWLSRGDLSTREGQAGPMIETPEAQCIGTGEFEYGFRVFRSEKELRSCTAELSDAQLKPFTVATENTPERLAEEARRMRAQYDRTRCSYISLDNTDFVLTACTKATNAPGLMVVRFFNSRNEHVSQTLSVAPFVTACNRAFLSEDPIERLRIVDGHITVSADPFQIVTLLLRHQGVSA
ncbi:MAG: alpha-mannosidase [Spirochaetaceae bacterium]